MDEKTSVLPRSAPAPVPEQQQQQRAPRSVSQRLAAFLGAAAIVYLGLSVLGAVCRVDHSTPSLDPLSTLPSKHNAVNATAASVPFEAHIMSKCPDARDCLQQLILPVMQRAADKVDFRLSYIGHPDVKTKTVTCMHGEQECVGNMIELCAASLFPEPKMYLGFTMCLSKNYRDIPQDELVSECALEHGLDEAKLTDCLIKDNGNYSNGLLLDSVQRSIDLGVKYSCTVRLNDKVRCIRDGGEWKDCEGGSQVSDIVREIEKLYDEKRN